MTTQSRKIKLISIVIPTYKSDLNLQLLIEKLVGILSKGDYDYEIIFVNDCSPDNTLELLKSICSTNLHIKVISFSRNFGQQIATTAGLMYAKGEAVIIMDDDLQDPPELIPTFIGKWEEGYDVVYAVRKTRQEIFIKKLGYKLFYKILSYLSHISIPQDSGDFGLLDSKVVKIINSMPERDRFLRGLRAWVGFKQTNIDYDRAPRNMGRPSYSILKIFKLSLDGIIAFSNVPLQISSMIGFVVASFAFIGMFLTILQRILTLFYPNYPLAVWPGFSTIVLSILFLGGIQLIGLGIIGEYIARIYNEVKQRPLYLIEEVIGFEEVEQEITLS
jgi:polyisoprenyl-phosphate glycosyltransferase